MGIGHREKQIACPHSSPRMPMNGQGREVKNAGLYAENGFINTSAQTGNFPLRPVVIDVCRADRPPRFRQCSPSPQSGLTPQSCCGAEQQSFSLPAGPISHLGTHDGKGVPRKHAHRAGSSEVIPPSQPDSNEWTIVLNLRPQDELTELGLLATPLRH